jgi:hypothetical protein
MRSRPLGITVIALVLTLGGLASILAGTEALGLTNLGLGNATNATSSMGWASIVSGLLTLVAAGGLFTLSGWAWWLAVLVMGARLVADAIVVFTHGLGSPIAGTALGGLVISLVALWYFNRTTVRRAFGR